jgi:hypothetical protein
MIYAPKVATAPLGHGPAARGTKYPGTSCLDSFGRKPGKRCISPKSAGVSFSTSSAMNEMTSLQPSNQLFASSPDDRPKPVFFQSRISLTSRRSVRCSAISRVLLHSNAHNWPGNAGQSREAAERSVV